MRGIGKRRRNRLAPLGELQLEVLDVLQKTGPATVYDVLAGFAEERRPRYTTALTVLRSLEGAGLVTHETSGRTFVFSACQEADRVRSNVLRDILNRVFGGSPADLMSALLDIGSVTPELAAELRAMIDEYEAETTPGHESEGVADQ